MTLSLAIVGGLTLIGAGATLFLRKLVHCVLALTVAFLGFAGLYLQLGAQFLGFAQILVYVGAVAILIVFAVLLTNGAGSFLRDASSATWLGSYVIALAIFVVMTSAVSSSRMFVHAPRSPDSATVGIIGNTLMAQFVLPLEIIGLLLTISLIGAVTIAMYEERKRRSTH